MLLASSIDSKLKKTIFCHKDSDPEKCRSWRVADDAPEDIDITLQQISEYIEHAV